MEEPGKMNAELTGYLQGVSLLNRQEEVPFQCAHISSPCGEKSIAPGFMGGWQDSRVPLLF
jgi:hypothetical protein